MQQAGFAQYPRPPVKEIDFGVISEGFNIVWKNLGPFVLAGFCGTIIPALASQGLSVVLDAMMGALPTPKTSADIGIFYAALFQRIFLTMPFNILLSALSAPFWYAISAMTLKVVRG